MLGMLTAGGAVLLGSEPGQVPISSDSTPGFRSGIWPSANLYAKPPDMLSVRISGVLHQGVVGADLYAKRRGALPLVGLPCQPAADDGLEARHPAPVTPPRPCILRGAGFRA